MSTKRPTYTDEFKKNIVTLHENGKTYAQLTVEYGVSTSAISDWVKQFSEVRLSDDTVLTARQIEHLRKRNAALEEENIILKKAAAIFMQHSRKD